MIDTDRFPHLALIGSAATLGGAFAFQYIGGLLPCVLCIYQRWPHGIAIALLAIALGIGAGGRAGRALVALSALAFLVGAGIAVYHVGVEQHWWAGTAACGSTAGPAESVAALRERLLATPVVRCDEPAWVMFGISMAGYILICLGLAGLCAMFLRRGTRTA